MDQTSPQPEAEAILTPLANEETLSILNKLDAINARGTLPPSLLPHGPIDGPDPGTTIKSQHGWLIGAGKHITEDQQRQLDELVTSKLRSFSFGVTQDQLPGYHGPAGDFLIAPPGTTLPPPDPSLSKKPRRWTSRELEAAHSKLQPLVDSGIIVPCYNKEYATNVVIAAKKDANTGLWTDTRLAVDYRFSNKHSPADPYPIPLPEQLFLDIKDAHWMSKLDLRQGFLQCHIPKHLQHVTAFWLDGLKAPPSHQGTSVAPGRLWCYTRMPYGMRNSPAHFQRVVDTTLSGAVTRIKDPATGNWVNISLSDIAKAYIDDILIFSKTFEEHCIHVADVLDALFNAGLRAHNEKSTFGCNEIEYLGHQLNLNERRPSAIKLQAILDLPSPTSMEALRRQLGFCGFYRNYCIGYSIIAKPLTELMSKSVKWDWDENPSRALAWAALKATLCKEGNALRNPDPSRPFIVHTDWSQAGCSAVLGQIDDDGKEYLVAALSRSNSPTERRYGSYKGEMMAACWGIRSLRHYLHSSKFPFRLYTDHRGLQWLMTNQHLEGVYARWATLLSEFDFTIHWKPGTTHQVADAPSRNPSPSTVDRTGTREPLSTDHTVRFLPPPPGLSTIESRVAHLTDEAPQDGNAALSLLAFLLSSTSVEPPHSVVFTSDDLTSQHYSHMLRPLPSSSSVAACMSLSFIDDHDASFDFPLSAHLSEVLPFTHFTHHEGSRMAEDLVSLHLPTLHTLPPYIVPTWSSTLVQGQPRVLSINAQEALDSSIADLYDGIVLLELFGGICAGLEMALRCGIMVSRYIYCDISTSAQQAASARCAFLSSTYPHLLSPSAWAHAFTTLPQDISLITQEHLLAAGAHNSDQWMLIAGFECQDLSPAGSGKGLSGRRSSTFYPLLSILGELQFLQPYRPPLYLIENTAMLAASSATQEVQAAYHELSVRLGPPVLLDAARVGSFAHRLRNYWTNVARTDAMQLVLDSITRDPSLSLTSILEPGTQPPLCTRVNPPPWYPANRKGQPIQVLPTLVATPRSYAFRPKDSSGGTGSGLVLTATGPRDLTLRERELALGYQPCISELHNLSFQDAHVLLGQAFDINAVHALLTIGLAIRHARLPTSPSHTVTATSATTLHVLSTTVDLQEASPSGALQEPYNDVVMLDFLRTNQFSNPSLTKKDKDRVQKRSRVYILRDQILYRRFPNGTLKQVPHPDSRESLIRQTHNATGHFGFRRTTHQLLLQHWWPNIYKDVRTVCRSCEACDRSHAQFLTPQPTLHSLPVSGLFYRWGMDLAGPLPKSSRGNRYVLVCIEHFSKWIEAFPLLDKTSSEVTYYAHQLFCRFMAPAEVVTDGGGEFEKEFHDLMVRLHIDHRVTSPNHPQSNGASERSVDILKTGLKRHTQAAGPESKLEWDLYLPSIVMGYNISPQASTRFSPYYLVFAVQPTLPSAIREHLVTPLDIDDPAAAAASLLHRVSILRRIIPMAGQNLLIAQHRDQLRYLRLRSKAYLPQASRFTPGDYVYLARNRLYRQDAAGLDLPARDSIILRVLEVRSSGTLLLIGQCGSTVVEHASNCSLCHLQIQASPSLPLPTPRPDHPCEICLFPTRPQAMLLCDRCNHGYHYDCLGLPGIPSGHWFCPSCTQADPSLPTSFPPATDSVSSSSPSPLSSTSYSVTHPVTTTPSIPLLDSPLPPSLPSSPPLPPNNTTSISTIPFPFPLPHPSDTSFWDPLLARYLHGHVLHREFPDYPNQSFTGDIRFLGARSRPYAFKIFYREDGDTETMSLAEVLHYLSAPSPSVTHLSPLV